MRLPNFAIIGTAKSGTTSLYYYLNQHPQIYMSAGLKEPNFFAYGEQDPPCFAGPVARLPDPYTHSLEAYMALFADVAQQTAIGEASTSNLESLRAHQRMKAYMPEAKFIVMLRHPADRAWSQFLHTRRKGWEPCADFRQAWQEEQQGKRRTWWHFLRYYENGLYAPRLDHLYRYFPLNQVRIYLYDDFVQDNYRVLRDIFQFLGVDSSFTPDITIHYNTAHRMSSQVTQQSRKQPSRFRHWLKRWLPQSQRRALIQFIQTFHQGKAPVMDQVLRQSITREFEVEIRQLQTMIQRDLTHWLPCSS